MSHLFAGFFALLLALPGSAQVGTTAPGKSSTVGFTSMVPVKPGQTRFPVCNPYSACDVPECPAYVFIGSGDWRLPINWANGQVPPEVLPACYKIIINPLGDEPCILTLPQGIMTGASLLVMPGKRVIIPGRVDNKLF